MSSVLKSIALGVNVATPLWIFAFGQEFLKAGDSTSFFLKKDYSGEMTEGHVSSADTI